MPKSTPAEWLLARLTDPTRAAALYGDLIELSSTRGRLWFFAAYLRTVGSLCWRPYAAFLVGYLCFLVASVTFQRPWVGPGARLQSHLIAMLQQGAVPLLSLLPFAVERLFFPIAGPLLVGITVPLRFVFPYAAVRYGVLDRFVQLAGATFLITTLVLIYPPVLSPLLAIALVLGFAAALILPRWRGSIIVLASTLAAGLVAIVGLFGVVTIGTAYLMEPHILHKSEIPSGTVSFVALFVPAVVCSWLHRRLLSPRLAGGVNA
jgi:hypothetical protein